MFELLRGGFSSHTAQKYRVAFYHNLSPDTLNQTISTEILKHRDKHSADNYGVQLSEVYVDHLSWQGDEESTREILKDNSTDEILQLVDRCGRDGYRVDLYREIMKQYAEMDVTERRKDQVFRKMMVLNTAKVQVIEPALVDGGEIKYVDDLCVYFGYETE